MKRLTLVTVGLLVCALLALLFVRTTSGQDFGLNQYETAEFIPPTSTPVGKVTAFPTNTPITFPTNTPEPIRSPTPPPCEPVVMMSEVRFCFRTIDITDLEGQVLFRFTNDGKLYFEPGAQYLYREGVDLFWFDGANSIKLNTQQ